MIHVCSLARLYKTVEETKAQHIVTLLRLTDRVTRPAHIAAENHLILAVDDIVDAEEGATVPAQDHVVRLIDFARAWDQSSPMVVHCFAGISRSTAAAFTAACALNPGRDEADIARAIRAASPTASPNKRIVAIADEILQRNGRMIRAVDALGRGEEAMEGHPFRLELT
ncbi:MAG: dual specificity protein phosphatase family protein [Proteobacteria bacterium]|nr:dual specificity protein phosphatase family protein [Pseudomonadota bacterium]